MKQREGELPNGSNPVKRPMVEPGQKSIIIMIIPLLFLRPGRSLVRKCARELPSANLPAKDFSQYFA